MAKDPAHRPPPGHRQDFRASELSNRRVPSRPAPHQYSNRSHVAAFEGSGEGRDLLVADSSAEWCRGARRVSARDQNYERLFQNFRMNSSFSFGGTWRKSDNSSSLRSGFAIVAQRFFWRSRPSFEIGIGSNTLDSSIRSLMVRCWLSR